MDQIELLNKPEEVHTKQFGIVFPFTSGLTGWISEWFAGLFTGLVTLALIWGICYWLYRKKIFIRI
ncbi:MAG: hypothetical protein HN936_01970 [Bacteroidetes bacterium]|nr:hypothetical protein [Bacteroidota bacterium]MBT7091983.1 hypothetical protein [Bacteroidota bacterium]